MGPKSKQNKSLFGSAKLQNIIFRFDKKSEALRKREQLFSMQTVPTEKTRHFL